SLTLKIHRSTYINIHSSQSLYINITVRTHPPFSAYPSTFHFEATKNNTYLNEIIDKKLGTMFAE
ncbi:hypothetical protein, partial [Salmonella enterica]|uniref:hypothetical protein n=1 Tax=Salmonella enterica TaxID=28901 RepID=UPI000D3AF56F